MHFLPFQSIFQVSLGAVIADAFSTNGHDWMGPNNGNCYQQQNFGHMVNGEFLKSAFALGHGPIGLLAGAVYKPFNWLL
jgi:hypothetical protein